jgi:hypothetical protein
MKMRPTSLALHKIHFLSSLIPISTFEKDLELVTGDDTADFSKQGDYDALPGSNN